MLAGCVNVAIEKLKGSKIFRAEPYTRSELTSYCFEELDQRSEEFQQFRNMYEGLVNNGDIGNFYLCRRDKSDNWKMERVIFCKQIQLNMCYQ